jgi:proton-translocating NADH-quinone oxidoreductase chain N
MTGVPLDAFAPEAILLAAALSIFLLDVLEVRRTEWLGGIAVVATLAGLVAVVADLGFAPFALLRTLPASVVDAAPSTTALFAFSSLGLIFQAIFLLSAFFVALASISRPSNEPGASIFFGLLLIATLGMLLVAISADLFFLLLAIEVVGIATYLMVGYTRRDGRALEAAMKFYIVGALSTALSFFGASLLFGAYGSTNLVVLSQSPGTVGYPSMALAGYALLIAGVGFKATLVPFHAWAVDVYDGAPTDVTAFLAGGSKKIGIFGLFLIFIGPVTLLSTRSVTCVAGACPVPYNFAPQFALTFGLIAVLTMTVGNVLALLQKEMKRMLAYSSISQAGYMLIGIAVGSSAAIAGATFQVFAHVFMKVGAFLVVAAAAQIGVGPLIADWKGMGMRRPKLAVAFALLLLSLAGIPLTVGFVSKFVLFSSAVEAQGWFVWLAVAGLLNSALSVFYYARVLKVMFMEAPDAEPPGAPLLPAGGIGYARAAAIGLAVVAVVLLGIYPGPVLSAVQTAAGHFVVTGA